MNKSLASLTLVVLCGLSAFGQWREDPRLGISREADNLVRDAEQLSTDSYNFLSGWDNVIRPDEQNILFKTEAFSSAAKLFARLSRDSNNTNGDNLRTNMNSAFSYLRDSLKELEESIRSTESNNGWDRRWRDNRNLPSRILRNVRDDMDAIERQYARWPNKDNEIYLAARNKYVRAQGGQAVYMIRKNDRTDEYEKVAFADIEALFAYHQKVFVRDPRRAKFASPWDNEEVTNARLLLRLPDSRDNENIGYEVGDVIAMGNPNRFEDVDPRNGGVYVVEMRDGQKSLRGFGSPEEVRDFMRLRNTNDIWKNIYHVPHDVLRKYGIPVN